LVKSIGAGDWRSETECQYRTSNNIQNQAVNAGARIGLLPVDLLKASPSLLFLIRPVEAVPERSEWFFECVLNALRSMVCEILHGEFKARGLGSGIDWKKAFFPFLGS
jgi:hypothetical protein